MTNDNNNFKFIGHIATIDNTFTDCTNNQIEYFCIHKIDNLKLEKCYNERVPELLSYLIVISMIMKNKKL